MKKILSILILFCLFFNVAYATTTDETIEEINVPITIDFLGEREFNLITELDTKNFKWTNGTTPSDYTWNMKLTRRYNWSDKCPDSAETWQNLTLELAQSRQECQEIVRLNNISYSIATEYADLREGLGKQSTKLEECQNNLVIANEEAARYTTCDIERQTAQSSYSVCNTEREDLKKKGDSNPLLWLAIGGGIVYFVTRKEKGQPQEYSEFGGREEGH